MSSGISVSAAMDALLIEVMHQDDISILHLSENCVDGVLRVSRLPVQCIHGPDDGRHSSLCEDRLTGIIDLSSRRAGHLSARFRLLPQWHRVSDLSSVISLPQTFLSDMYVPRYGCLSRIRDLPCALR